MPALRSQAIGGSDRGGRVMEIGKPQREYILEPREIPVPLQQPAPEPSPTVVPEPELVPEPAAA